MRTTDSLTLFKWQIATNASDSDTSDLLTFSSYTQKPNRVTNGDDAFCMSHFIYAGSHVTHEEEGFSAQSTYLMEAFMNVYPLENAQ